MSFSTVPVGYSNPNNNSSNNDLCNALTPEFPQNAPVKQNPVNILSSFRYTNTQKQQEMIPTLSNADAERMIKDYLKSNGQGDKIVPSRNRAVLKPMLANAKRNNDVIPTIGNANADTLLKNYVGDTRQEKVIGISINGNPKRTSASKL